MKTQTKYSVPLMILILALSTHIKAQVGKDSVSSSRFYLNLKAGYGIGVNGTYASDYVGNNDITYVSKIGNGIIGNASFGYQATSNIGFELGVGYFDGFQNNISPPHNTVYDNASGQMLQIIPSVVFSAPLGKVRPYLRLGFVYGFGTLYNNSADTLVNGNYPFGAVEAFKKKFYNGYGIGLQSDIGCLFALNKKISLFAEASFGNISFLAGHSTVYSYTINGTDQLSTLQAGEKEIEYKKSVEPFSSTYPNQNVTQQLQVSIPFGSLSFNIGVRLNLDGAPLYDVKQNNNDHFYIRIQGGYGFIMNGDHLSNFPDTSKRTLALFSGGTGMNLGIGAGYMFTPNFGVDLGVNYVAGNTLNYTILPDFDSSYDYGSLKGSMWQLTTDIVLATHISKFQPYTRFGVIFGSGNVYMTDDLNVQTYQEHLYQKWKYFGGLSTGFNAVLGVAYPILPKLDIYIESAFNTIYLIPQKATLTEASENGQDILGRLSVQNKNKVFSTSINNSANNDASKPDVVEPVKYSFCSVVTSVGVRVHF